MITLSKFLQWHYLIFLLPGLVAVLLVLVSSAFSLGGDADPDSDTASGSDVEAEGDTDSDDEKEAGGGLLRLVGADKAPLSLVGGAFFLGWGFFGFWADELLAPWLKSPTVFVAPAVILALIGSVLTARAVAAVTAHVIPKEVTAAVSRESLVGQEAQVVYPISEAGGRAFFYDKNAVLHDVTCRVRPGEAAIPKGRKIILAGYDPESRWFWVEVSPFGED